MEGGNKQNPKQNPSCPEFTYIIFHGLLWRVELLVVGPATLGVNQPARQQMTVSQAAWKYLCTQGTLE